MDLITHSIRNKLLMISGTGTATLIAAVLFGFWLSWSSMQTLEQQIIPANDEIYTVLTMESDFKKQVQEWKNVLLRGKDPASLDKHWSSFEALEKKVQQDGHKLLKTDNCVKGKEAVTQFLQAHEALGASYRKGLQAFKEAGFDSGVGDKAVKGVDRAPTELLVTAAKEYRAFANVSSNEAVAKGFYGIKLSLALMAAAILVAFVSFLWLVQKEIITPAKYLVQSLDKLAQGDFSSPILQSTSDEIGQIAGSAEQVRRDLGKIILQINQSSQELTHAAGNLSAAAGQVATASSQQTATTSSVAAAVEQLTASIEQVSLNAEDARRISLESGNQSTQGALQVREATAEMAQIAVSVSETSGQMAELNAQAQQIGGIASVIKEIADQTNLLALNASIEAARAGEQGRGFAVVADEVRNLAARTATSVEEITQTIGNIQAYTDKANASMQKGNERVSHGVELAKLAGDSMQKISTSSEGVVHAVSDISEALHGQKIASSEISHNVEHIARMTEENSVAVSSGSAAADSLQNLALKLKQAISNFKV